MVLGSGPVGAIPVAPESAGNGIEDVDLFELSQVFGSQADYCIENLSLNRDIVNLRAGVSPSITRSQ